LIARLQQKADPAAVFDGFVCGEDASARLSRIPDQMQLGNLADQRVVRHVFRRLRRRQDCACGASTGVEPYDPADVAPYRLS
jgi:hypothetical protein